MANLFHFVVQSIVTTVVFAAFSHGSRTGALEAHLLDSRGANDFEFSFQQVLDNPFPFYFPPEDKAETPDLFPMPDCHGFALQEATIDRMQEALDNGILTSVQLVQCYTQRIMQVDGYVNSVLEINPDHIAIAQSLDAERAAGNVRGPLHGIPFLVKDNIATKDKMETTVGSWALVGSVVPRDAHVVHLLREAGALLLGKATCSEWADMRSTNYSEGYSARGGQARTPYNLTRSPGGSSSGSAAAVAANNVPFTLGTETDGSVIDPAWRNGLVGFKQRVIPESEHQDTIGPFTRSVRDAVYVLDAIYGLDSRDDYTLAQSNKTPTGGYAQFLTSKTSLQKAKFGIPWSTFWTYAAEEQKKSLSSLIKYIESAGATIINGTEFPNAAETISPNGWDWAEYTVVCVDFYNNINSYLAELTNTPIRNLADIVQYNIDNAGEEGGVPNNEGRGHPAFYSGQDSFLDSLATRGVRNETYFQAVDYLRRSAGLEGIDAALANGGRRVDALLVPPSVGQTYQAAAQAGYPMLTLPVGVNSDSGVPFGLGLMVSAWEEEKLVRWGSAIEDLIRSDEEQRWGRRLPRWFEYRARNVPVL
ncbi:glutamyl-tRNA amidotransferase subunit A [Pseudovirgaria hyperparasitica]|uniref:Glutamyl-tRNA amidotransferase subunit A n=1 Tax=Pseudovirgaria hyperparasitica TaxID=470096 RepID=A0A6A6WKD7_9PEZI|nr:glutamyl-tRNA amidotransferase subunit A [Pseudovirgaria hyperparasitica]KAF2762622.1 glutamyl-tRNA amidotransferase subunit A [Pseudovirgaria hyperparasitica]